MQTKKEKIVKEKLPTLEEFLLKKESESEPNRNNIKEWMIEFTKIHLSEAFEQISKKFKNPDNIRAIKKTYSLDNVE